jgi:hypothetical protein
MNNWIENCSIHIFFNWHSWKNKKEFDGQFCLRCGFNSDDAVFISRTVYAGFLDKIAFYAFDFICFY